MFLVLGREPLQEWGGFFYVKKHVDIFVFAVYYTLLALIINLNKNIMKKLIKIIIFLFLLAVMILYISIPVVGYAKNPLMPLELPWYLAWYVIEHCIVGVAIFVIPLIFITNWIDENVKS